jgi:hypothetical protein
LLVLITVLGILAGAWVIWDLGRRVGVLMAGDGAPTGSSDGRTRSARL